MTPKKFIVILSFILLTVAPIALAHNPRIIQNGQTVRVQNPEISQAFYGVLSGEQWFEINSDKKFILYANLLVPKLPGINTDLLFYIYKLANNEQKLIATLDGQSFQWTEFYEPFGGDRYLKGPEYRAEVDRGRYLIKVTHCQADLGSAATDSACAFSKYILVIGEQESFPPKEILNALWLLPVLKKDFFGRSPLTAYFNYSGLFLLGALIIIAIVAYIVIKIAKKKTNIKTDESHQTDL